MRLVCLVFILSLTVASHAPPADTTISNFSKVNDFLYRGGRPNPGGTVLTGAFVREQQRTPYQSRGDNNRDGRLPTTREPGVRSSHRF